MNKLIISIVIPIILLIVVLSFFTSPRFNVTIDTCEVTDKEVIYDIESKTRDYRIYTSCGTYRVNDSLFAGIFNSSDIYGSIKANKTYMIKSGGYRVPFLSMFKTIIQVKEI